MILDVELFYYHVFLTIGVYYVLGIHFYCLFSYNVIHCLNHEEPPTPRGLSPFSAFIFL